MRSKAGLWITILAVVSLTIGVIWTIRTAPPSPTPWWWGKNPDFHVEVWEAGKEDATVAMTMPKKTVDALVAFGLKSSVSAGRHKVYLGEVHSQVERLPHKKLPPRPLWLAWIGGDLPQDLHQVWRWYLRRFTVEHRQPQRPDRRHAG